MIHTKLNILLCFAILLSYCCISCEALFPPKEQRCTDIFKSESLKIKGPALDSCYTICIANRDTFHLPSYSESYRILNDHYKDSLVNGRDSFLFVGIIKDSIVVSEPYTFGNDGCHIYKISGKASIQLHN